MDKLQQTCAVTMETLDKFVRGGAIKSQQSKRFLFAFLCYTVTAKKNKKIKYFSFGLKQLGKCSVTCSIPLSEFRTSSAEAGKKRHCVQTFNEKLEV